jgi:putative MATE family efflux protein
MNAPKRPPDLYTLSWPIFVEGALMLLIGTIVLWMAGEISAGAVAIFGLSLQLRFFFDRIFRIVAVGASVVISQHRGAGDMLGARLLAKASFTLSLWLGVAAFLLIGAWPEALLRVLHLPDELMPAAVPFMGAVAIALAVEAINVTMFSVLRSFTLTKISMRLVMAMNLLHIVVSVPMVFGVGPIPPQGLMGLAYALIVSRVAVFAMLIWTWHRQLGVRLMPIDAVRATSDAMRSILRIGLPSAGEKITFRLCYMATVAMAGSMGAVALATHAYATHIMSVVGLFANSFGIGSEIIVGHNVGAAKLRQANQTLWRTLWLCLLVTGAVGLSAWLVAPWLISLISDNPAIPALLAIVLFIDLFAGVGRTVNVVLLGGLRAAGDVQFPVKASVLVNVTIGTGLAWLLGVHWGWGLPGLWVAYTLDESVRGAVMALRWRYLGWTPLARATRRRILAKHRLRAATASS